MIFFSNAFLTHTRVRNTAIIEKKFSFEEAKELDKLNERWPARPRDATTSLNNNISSLNFNTAAARSAQAAAESAHVGSKHGANMANDERGDGEADHQKSGLKKSMITISFDGDVESIVDGKRTASPRTKDATK